MALMRSEIALICSEVEALMAGAVADGAAAPAAGDDAPEAFASLARERGTPVLAMSGQVEAEIASLDDPEDHVVSAIRDYTGAGTVPDPRSLPLFVFMEEVERHGEIVVKERETGSFGLGLSGELGAETQKVGLSGQVEGSRTTERVVYRYPVN